MVTTAFTAALSTAAVFACNAMDHVPIDPMKTKPLKQANAGAGAVLTRCSN
jgi:hypothetical protein